MYICLNNKRNLEYSRGEGNSIYLYFCFFHVLSSFIISLSFHFYHFLSISRTFISHSFRTGLLVTNSLSSPLGNMLVSPSFLTLFKVPLLSLSVSRISISHSYDTSFWLPVSYKKSIDIQIVSLIGKCFSLAVFKVLPLFLVFKSLITFYLGIYWGCSEVIVWSSLSFLKF